MRLSVYRGVEVSLSAKSVEQSKSECFRSARIGENQLEVVVGVDIDQLFELKPGTTKSPDSLSGITKSLGT